MNVIEEDVKHVVRLYDSTPCTTIDFGDVVILNGFTCICMQTKKTDQYVPMLVKILQPNGHIGDAVLNWLSRITEVLKHD